MHKIIEALKTVQREHIEELKQKDDLITALQTKILLHSYDPMNTKTVQEEYIEKLKEKDDQIKQLQTQIDKLHSYDQIEDILNEIEDIEHKYESNEYKNKPESEDTKQYADEEEYNDYDYDYGYKPAINGWCQMNNKLPSSKNALPCIAPPADYIDDSDDNNDENVQFDSKQKSQKSIPILLPSIETLRILAIPLPGTKTLAKAHAPAPVPAPAPLSFTAPLPAPLPEACSPIMGVPIPLGACSPIDDKTDTIRPKYYQQNKQNEHKHISFKEVKQQTNTHIHNMNTIQRNKLPERKDARKSRFGMYDKPNLMQRKTSTSNENADGETFKLSNNQKELIEESGIWPLIQKDISQFSPFGVVLYHIELRNTF